jgi:cell division protein FtsA
MFRRKEIITAIEIATTKVRVLVGEADDEGRSVVLGYCERDTNGGVCKGEITDLEKIIPALREAVEEADAASGFELDRNRIFLTLSGGGIGSTQGVGTVIPANQDGRITVADINEAQKNALNRPIGYDRMILNTFESGYLLDGRPVRNPLGQSAEKLEVLVHIIHGRSKRVENFINALRDFGFNPDNIRPVFSAAAAVFGVLTTEERENGVLLIDMGAGTTEAVAVRHDGMQASCVIPVGFDHIANDLSVGLELHISNCRKLLVNGSVQDAKDSDSGFIEIRERINAAPRKVPLNSIEKIISARLQEITSIIQNKLEQENPGILGSLGSGCVLTGGGGLYPGTTEVCRRQLGMPVRCGFPINAGIAVAELNSPRCGVIWGAFRYGLEMRNVLEDKDDRNPLERGIEAVDTMVMKKVHALRRSLKI